MIVNVDLNIFSRKTVFLMNTMCEIKLQVSSTTDDK